ncbi:MAG: hypothetical protein FVQ77_16040, partial [Cytophagales bacterium]|nr:hypothetical protein [Cytophagales bacterium]
MKTITFLFAIVLFFGQYRAYGQCTNCTANFPSGTFSTTCPSTWTNVSTCIFGGEYSFYSVTSGCTYEWQTCGDADFDTQLTLYPSASCSGASLAYNDDFCSLQSSISWTATFTGTVRVLVSKFSCLAQSSCMTLQWQCTGCTGGGPPNDNCTGAQAVTCGSVTSSTTVGANPDVAPTCVTGDGTGGGVWYSIVGTGNDITASLCGSSYDTKIRVYTGSCGILTCVTGNDDNAGACGLLSLQSEVTWTSTSGTTYYILVHGFGSSEGAFDLTITCASGGQPNQYCVDAIDICGPTTLTGSTDGALNQLGIDPAVTLWACNAVYDNYVFYTFTTDPAGSPVVLNMTFNCGGSYLQTAIFDVPPLPCQNASLWSNSLFCTELNTSPYTINATGLQPNTLYYIIIDQWPGNACNFTMNISGNGGCYVCPSAPGIPADQDCINAVPICEYQYCQQNSYSGAGANPNEINTLNSCLLGGEVNNVWYTLTVVSGGQLSFVIVPNNGTDDYDWAVYNLTTANCSDIFSTPSLEVSCNWSADPGPTGPNGNCGACGIDPCVSSASDSACKFSPTIPVSAGQTYAINVSNWTGSTAGYVIDFSASTAVIFDNVAPTISSLASTPACNTTSITFNLSENVLCSSVQACDFTVTGPQGTTVTGISGVACGIGTQENTFTIILSPALTTGGSYNLNLVTGCGSVEDLCGNVAPAGSLPFTVSAVSVTTSQTNVSCFGGTTGSATAFPTGGTSPYSYSWTNGCLTQVCTGLSAGGYTVTVTDANGCMGTASLTIAQPTAISLSMSSTATNCAGACDGSVSVSATGGAGGFTYSWSPGGQTTSSVTGRCAGTYTVTVTDANGCTASASVVVVNGPVVTAGFTYNGNQCLSGNSYSFTNTGTTGCAYTWNFGDLSGTSPLQNPTYSYAACGSFTVTQTVTCGACTATTSVLVTVFCQPSITSIAGTDITCNGACNGAANLTQTGGTSFSWTGPGAFTAITEDIAGLCLGTYNVTVTNVNGCTASSSVFINQPSVLGTSITSQTNVLCNGDATGSVTVAGSGGTPTYTYSLNGGPFVVSGTFSGLTTGSYTVTVKDANGCTVVQPVTITQPSLLTASITAQTNVLCTGDATGSVTVAGSGGAGGYTYSIGGPFQGSGTFTVLLAGSYTVTVQDANGCQVTQAVTITEPASALSVSIPTSANVTCFGVCDGSASSSVSGGTPPYGYSWAPAGGIGPSASGLCAALYTVTVTDANGCVQTANVNITESPALTAVTVGDSVSCNGECDGQATVTPSGGTGPGTYSYQWDGNTGFQTTQTATGLCAGTYNVTVTDANSCTFNISYTVGQPPAMTLTPGSVDAACGIPNGEASVAVAGGTPGYTYLWSPGGGTTPTITSLTAGAYTVTVTDAKLCSDSVTISVNDAGAPTASIVSSDSVTCNGGSDGSATATGSGGVRPFTWSWSPPVSVDSFATGLQAGTYTVSITDDSGCVASATVIISEPPALIASITSSTPVACNGDSTGSATVSVSGGTGGYTWSWLPYGGSGPTADSLIAGIYCVTVTDGNGCIANECVTINEPAALSTFIIGTDISCNGGTNGAADLTVTGGTGAGTYTYLWCHGPTSQDVGNLSADTFCVTVTDANGCTTVDSVIINEPAPLALITFINTDANCGLADGEAYVTVTGGTGSYTYSWNTSPIQLDDTAKNLTSGVWCVTVGDANSCSAVQCVTINDIGGGTPTITLNNNVSCNGGSDGSATVTMSGGTAPFTHLWDNTEISATAIALTAGAHCDTITDFVGCVSIGCITITEPPPITITITPTDPLCNGECTGEATATVTGGTPPYTYFWTSGDTDSTAVNLCTGVYTLVVTDTAGCVKAGAAFIGQPPALTTTISATDASCFGVCDGSATVTPSGGSPLYTYLWSPGGQTTQTITGLCAGTHCVTIKDIKGCTLDTCIAVNEPLAIVLATGSIDATCGDSNGVAYVTVTSGGFVPFTYQWDAQAGGQTTDTATGLAAGAYTVVVTDNTGCKDSATVLVNDVGSPSASIFASIDANCFGACDGYAQVNITGGTPPYTYLWDDTGNSTTSSVSTLCAGFYTIIVTDTNGCIAITSVTISEPDSITTTFTTINEKCYLACDGEATVHATGGTPPYSYLWDGFQIDSTATGLCGDGGTGTGGAFVVQITDTNGCVKTNEVSIIPAMLLAIVNVNIVDPTCDSLGTATMIINGGYPPYTYLWIDNGSGDTIESSITVDSLSGGSYTPVVIDSNGCIATEIANVNDVQLPALSIDSVIHVSCFGDSTGIAIVVVDSGGTPPFTYEWFDGPGSPIGQTGSIATGLTAGTYIVEVTDSNNCTASIDTVITEPSSIVTATAQLSPTCIAACNGWVNVSVIGGTPPYSYLWSNGDTTFTADTLCAGTHVVEVTDANNCPAVYDTATIVDPTPIELDSIVIVNVSCNGLSNGSITSIPTGGAGGYSWLWPTVLPPNTLPTASNLSAGSYTVIVTDANGCQEIFDSIQVTEPTLLVLADTTLPDTCAKSVGIAIVNVSGGTVPYTYSWNTSPVPQVNDTATSLLAGQYTITVTDSNGCEDSLVIFVGNLPGPVIDAFILIKEIFCNGDSTGSVAVQTKEGAPPYVYNWTPIGGNDSIIDSLGAALYSVTVIDGNGCETTDSVLLKEPALIEATFTIRNESCKDAGNGSATVSTFGGIPPYTFYWNSDTLLKDSVLTGLSAGVHNVIIYDSAGCKIIDSVVVGFSQFPNSSSTSFTDLICNEDSTGIAQVSIWNAVPLPPYTYVWFILTTIISTDSMVYDTISSITNVPAGIYKVYITDSLGCLGI